MNYFMAAFRFEILGLLSVLSLSLLYFVYRYNFGLLVGRLFEVRFRRLLFHLVLGSRLGLLVRFLFKLKCFEVGESLRANQRSLSLNFKDFYGDSESVFLIVCFVDILARRNNLKCRIFLNLSFEIQITVIYLNSYFIYKIIRK